MCLNLGHVSLLSVYISEKALLRFNLQIMCVIKWVKKLCRLSLKRNVLTGCKDKPYGGGGGKKNESREHCFCVPVKSECN